MKSEAIIDEYKSRFRKLSKHYDELFDDFEPDNNHYFRVEIKKLRAFFRLVNTASQGQDQKISKRIKKFYRLAGDIRNLQLHHQRINGLCKDLLISKPDAYMDYFQEKEAWTKKKTGKLKEKISFHDFEDQLIKEVPEELTSENKNTFVQSYRSRLIQLLTLPYYFDETFHDIRKTLKDLMYNYEFIEHSVKTIIPPALSELETMESLTSVLGDFHDLCMALLFLNPTNLPRVGGNNEAHSLYDLTVHLNLRKEKMKTEIINILQSAKSQIQQA